MHEIKMESLILEAKKGNSDAFTRLMQSQLQNMYKAASAILNNDEDVADAISDTILTCWEKLCQLKNPAFFRTWMTRILINKCKDIIRKQRGFLSVEELPEQPVYDTKYENAEWKDALNTLDEKHRIVMVLYYVEGFNTVEISDMLELPESTVRSRLSRGREKLARSFIGGKEYERA
ncbi:MAG: RNA polymerase sigma factor [Lachnospiraceae bacterium]|nr:RNA polymerase sigma factor [Lachnospiraceae bacterium]